MFVHVWAPNERVYTDGFVDPRYRADPASTTELERVASAAGGASFGETKLGAIARTVRAYLGHGPTVAQSESRSELSLAATRMVTLCVMRFLAQKAQWCST